MWAPDRLRGPVFSVWCYLTLFTGEQTVLDKNNPDTDGDGLEDGEEIELAYEYSEDGKKVKVTGIKYSDPTKEDTDGDTLEDVCDLNPFEYDYVPIEISEDFITFNSGRSWAKFPMTAYDYVTIINAGMTYTSNYKEAESAAKENRAQKFSTEELELIAILDINGAQVYMDSEVSEQERLEIFESLVGRKSYYYQHQGLLWWTTWAKLDDSETDNSSHFKGRILSEAEINLSLAAYCQKGVDYIDLANTLAAMGATVLTVYIAAAFTEWAVVQASALAYYIQNFGVGSGITTYVNFGTTFYNISTLEDGVVQVIETDLSDGKLDGVEAVAEAVNNETFHTPGFEEWLNKGEPVYKVYHGIIGDDARYVGITKQTLAARLYQHNHAGKGFSYLQEKVAGLTRNQARAIEQYYIQTEFLQKLGKGGMNLINSIAPKHRYYQEAINWAEKFLEEGLK